MAKILTLNSRTRTVKGKKVKQLRNKGLIPAVLYGSKIDVPISIEIPYKEFESVYKEGGENTLINLHIDNASSHNVVIHDMTEDPILDRYAHADFYAVNMAEKITTQIPLEFEGVSDAVKNLGGVLVKSKDELEIESLPGDIPSKIIVDISKLKTFEDIIRVEDLDVPEKVAVLDDANEAVATVAPPRSEEELEALNEKIEEKVEEVKEAGAEAKEEPVEEEEK